MTSLTGRVLAGGLASGELVLLSEALSFWGGVDIASGTIADTTHPQCGELLAGKVVAMKTVRGSSSASSALVECIRLGTSPAAILLAEADPILLIGCLVGADLYGIFVPLIVVPGAAWPALEGASNASIDASEQSATINLQTGTQTSLNPALTGAPDH